MRAAMYALLFLSIIATGVAVGRYLYVFDGTNWVPLNSTRYGQIYVRGDDWTEQQECFEACTDNDAPPAVGNYYTVESAIPASDVLGALVPYNMTLDYIWAGNSGDAGCPNSLVIELRENNIPFGNITLHGFSTTNTSRMPHNITKYSTIQCFAKGSGSCNASVLDTAVELCGRKRHWP